MICDKRPRWRFDDAYGKVFRYSAEHGAFLFYADYWQAGIRPNMRDATKVRLAESLIR